jgi:hypothetical protein
VCHCEELAFCLELGKKRQRKEEVMRVADSLIVSPQSAMIVGPGTVPLTDRTTRSTPSGAAVGVNDVEPVSPTILVSALSS